jgi:hypothetical protein
MNDVAHLDSVVSPADVYNGAVPVFCGLNLSVCLDTSIQRHNESHVPGSRKFVHAWNFSVSLSEAVSPLDRRLSSSKCVCSAELLRWPADKLFELFESFDHESLCFLGILAVLQCAIALPDIKSGLKPT